jgi:hypothetical protein
MDPKLENNDERMTQLLKQAMFGLLKLCFLNSQEKSMEHMKDPPEEQPKVHLER